uniref:START domain-containing protein n=1 Tax=Hucho hucho TaxID=62062 RepID=A0A4W5R6K1_9TELE
MPVQIPDDADFTSFKEQCENHEGWTARYSKGSVTVWCRDEECKTIQKLKASVSLLQHPSGTLLDHSITHTAVVLFCPSPLRDPWTIPLPILQWFSSVLPP